MRNCTYAQETPQLSPEETVDKMELLASLNALDEESVRYMADKFTRLQLGQLLLLSVYRTVALKAE